MNEQKCAVMQSMSLASEKKVKVREFYGRAASAPVSKQYSSELHVSSVFETERLLIILDFLSDLAPQGSKVLDVGCGPGEYASVYVANGYNYFGMDISPETIEQAKGLNTSRGLAGQAQFFVGDLESTEFAANLFDVVVVVYVFEYLNSDVTALQELRRILKPGGLLITGLNARYSYNRMVRLATLRPLKGVLSRMFPMRHGCQTFRYRSHHPPQFIHQLHSSGFDFLRGRYCNFSIIPFNLRMPRSYFAVHEQLSSVLSSSGWNFPFSTYLGVFQARHD